MRRPAGFSVRTSRSPVTTSSPDVMLAMIGAFLGWQLVIVTLVFSSIAGSVIGVLLIVTRRGGLKYALPYGTFLSIAALVASLAGAQIVNWYVGMYYP